MSPAETTIVLVVLVAVVALVIRWFSRDEPLPRHEPADQVEALLADVSRADETDVEGVVAITSDGWAFVPDEGEVQIIPPATHEEDLPIRSTQVTGAGMTEDPLLAMEGGRGGPVSPRSRRPVGSWKPGEHIDHGDLLGVRIVRGAPDLDPWRVEAIGRDGDYRAWFFETPEAGRAALELLERVVRVPRGEDGDPAPLGPADFEAARRRDEETEQALDAPDDD